MQFRNNPFLQLMAKNSTNLTLQALKGLKTDKAAKKTIKKKTTKYVFMEFPSSQEGRKDLTIKRLKCIFRKIGISNVHSHTVQLSLRTIITQPTSKHWVFSQYP